MFTIRTNLKTSRIHYTLVSPFPVAEKDVFDKLFEEAPEKLEAVKRVSLPSISIA